MKCLKALKAFVIALALLSHLVLGGFAIAQDVPNYSGDLDDISQKLSTLISAINGVSGSLVSGGNNTLADLVASMPVYVDSPVSGLKLGCFKDPDSKLKVSAYAFATGLLASASADIAAYNAVSNFVYSQFADYLDDFGELDEALMDEYLPSYQFWLSNIDGATTHIINYQEPFFSDAEFVPDSGNALHVHDVGLSDDIRDMIAAYERGLGLIVNEFGDVANYFDEIKREFDAPEIGDVKNTVDNALDDEIDGRFQSGQFLLDEFTSDFVQEEDDLLNGVTGLVNRLVGETVNPGELALDLVDYNVHSPARKYEIPIWGGGNILGYEFPALRPTYRDLAVNPWFQRSRDAVYIIFGMWAVLRAITRIVHAYLDGGSVAVED